MACEFCAADGGTPAQYKVTFAGFVNDPAPALDSFGEPAPNPLEPERWNVGEITLTQVSGTPCTYHYTDGVRDYYLIITAAGIAQLSNYTVEGGFNGFCNGGEWSCTTWNCCTGGNFEYNGGTISGCYGVDAVVFSVVLTVEPVSGACCNAELLTVMGDVQPNTSAVFPLETTHTATPTGGVGPYTYVWDFVNATPTPVNVRDGVVTWSSAGTWTVTVTDCCGRTAQFNGVVTNDF